jgi:hypothetical protein
MAMSAHSSRGNSEPLGLFAYGDDVLVTGAKWLLGSGNAIWCAPARR